MEMGPLRKSISVRLEEGGDLAAADRLRARIADAGKLLAHALAVGVLAREAVVEVEHVVGVARQALFLGAAWS